MKGSETHDVRAFCFYSDVLPKPSSGTVNSVLTFFNALPHHQLKHRQCTVNVKIVNAPCKTNQSDWP